MSKGISMLCSWEPPPAVGAGQRFLRGDPRKFESNTPKTFSPQFNFGNVSQALKDGPTHAPLPTKKQVVVR
jgi:hypothetical protein